MSRHRGHSGEDSSRVVHQVVAGPRSSSLGIARRGVQALAFPANRIAARPEDAFTFRDRTAQWTVIVAVVDAHARRFADLICRKERRDFWHSRPPVPRTTSYILSYICVKPTSSVSVFRRTGVAPIEKQARHGKRTHPGVTRLPVDQAGHRRPGSSVLDYSDRGRKDQPGRMHEGPSRPCAVRKPQGRAGAATGMRSAASCIRQ